MAWREAASLLKLRDQINAGAPNRRKDSDGMIAGAAHHVANPNSDHEAWVTDRLHQPVVTAIDITHDPAHGVDTYKMADALLRSKDPRIKYVISNRRIGSATVAAWQWRPYHGVNPHDQHMHVSCVSHPQERYDDVSPWNYGQLVADKTSPDAYPKPTLKFGATGHQVSAIQRAIGMESTDGYFGHETEAAVREYQKAHGFVADGIVGPQTWKALGIA